MKSFSKQLTEDMADLLFGSLKMYSNYSDIKRRLEDFLSKVTCDDIDVPIEEFLDLYDMRAYNFDSKRADIKVLKIINLKVLMLCIMLIKISITQDLAMIFLER